MAGSINKVILVGNLGRDPEVRTLNDGNPVVNLSIATSESWKDRQSGERREKTEWHRVVIFNEALAKVAQNYLRKGSKVYLEGALQTRKWTDQQGQEKYTTEVVLQKYRGELTMLDGRGDNAGGSYQGDDAYAGGGMANNQPTNNQSGNQGGGFGQGGGYAAGSGPAGGPSGGDLDDEIPF